MGRAERCAKPQANLLVTMGRHRRFDNGDLIQTGTEADYYNGSAHYTAWWEILPAAATVIPSITVRPGDRMTASITKGSGSDWTITITDTTNGRVIDDTAHLYGPRGLGGVDR